MDGFDLAILCECPEEEHVVRAAVTPVPGLAICALLHNPGQWGVTHIASGCLVAAPCSDPESALHIAMLFAVCGDWNRPGTDVARDTPMQARRRAALAALGLLEQTRKHPHATLLELQAREGSTP